MISRLSAIADWAQQMGFYGKAADSADGFAYPSFLRSQFDPSMGTVARGGEFLHNKFENVANGE
jgi:hypothetical protein